MNPTETPTAATRGAGTAASLLELAEARAARAEAELAQTRHLLQTIIDATPLRIFWKDINLRYLGCNARFASDAGKAGPREVLGKDDHELAWADQAERYRTDDRQVVSSGKSKIAYEEPQTTPDGRTIWLRTSKVPLKSREGETFGLLGVYEDISQYRRSEEALRQTEVELQSILGSTVDGILAVNRAGKVIQTNPRFAELWRIPQAIMESKDDQALLGYVVDQLAEPEAFLHKVQSLYDSTLETKDSVLFRDGRVFERFTAPMLMNGKVAGRVWSFRDITDRERAERNLNLAVDVGQILLWELDLANDRFTYDTSKLALLGLEPDDALLSLTGWIQRVHPDDQPQFLGEVQRALEPGATPFDHEYRMLTRSGDTVWVATKARVPHRDADGRSTLALGTSTNITARRNAEEAIRVSEERSRQLASMLRLMCDNVPDMIWAKDLDKRYLFANQAICNQLLNASGTEEPIGRTDLFFALRERESHRDNPAWHTFGELCQDSDTITLQSDKPCVFEEFGNVKGEPLILDVHKAPFRDANGTVIGVVGSARDITGRSKIEKELQQYRERLEELVEQRTSDLIATEARASHILHSSADGLYGVDANGRITFINRAACEMLGRAESEMIGQQADALFHHSRPDGTPYADGESPCHAAVRTGASIRVDNEVHWHADGHAIPVMYAVHPMFDNGINTGAVISFVDVSTQRAAALAQEHALIAAENLAQVRRDFLANMSHEIRTPLNGVLGFAQLGRRQYNDSAKARRAFDKILSSGSLLLGVINDVLDFSKIEAGRIDIDKTEMVVSNVIDEVIDHVSERAHIKGLQLRVERGSGLPRTCVCDALRLRQVLLNLLTNAVKFTEAGSVTLSVSRSGDDLLFTVTDTGIGMTREQLQRLFNPFQQADSSTTRRFGGTGLGLAISKNIMELMGGDIRVASQLGLGSRFECRLPCVSTEGTASAPAGSTRGMPPSDPPLAGLRILIADDDPNNQDLLAVTLGEEGAITVIAHNGREALELVRSEGPDAYDVVLMDVQMPEMDGYEATRQINLLAPSLPIIGQTAHALTEERESCLAAGMVAYVAKPLELGALVNLVRQYTCKT
ncbi:MAG: PAS domain-containing protein [Steroidobacteraceae bacterium]